MVELNNTMHSNINKGYDFKPNNFLSRHNKFVSLFIINNNYFFNFFNKYIRKVQRLNTNSLECVSNE